MPSKKSSKKEPEKKKAPPAPEKRQDPLFQATPRNFRVGGDIRPTRAVSRALVCAVGVVGVGLLGGLVSAVIGERFVDPSPRRGRWPWSPDFASAWGLHCVRAFRASLPGAGTRLR